MHADVEPIGLGYEYRGNNKRKRMTKEKGYIPYTRRCDVSVCGKNLSFIEMNSKLPSTVAYCKASPRTKLV